MAAIIYDRKAVIMGDLENRLEKCREYCLASNLEVIVEITEYHSGIGFPKPGFVAALTAAQSAGQEVILIAWSPDRISRDKQELNTMTSECEANGINIVYVNHPEVK